MEVFYHIVLYETGRRGRTKEERIEKDKVASSIDNVLTKTAKVTNVSAKTVQRARVYVKEIAPSFKYCNIENPSLTYIH